MPSYRVVSDGVEAYEMQQGDTRGVDINFFDFTYDGDVSNTHLSGGIGQLIDFEEGGDDFRHDPQKTGRRGYEWVGWKNDSTSATNSPPVELTFTFDTIRNFSHVSIHTHNNFNKDISLFREARVFFSIAGEHYTDSPIIYRPLPDTVFERPRYVDVVIPHKVGAFAKVQLFYADRWIMISEVRFINGK